MASGTVRELVPHAALLDGPARMEFTSGPTIGLS
jgi:hypothetical protein